MEEDAEQPVSSFDFPSDSSATCRKGEGSVGDRMFVLKE